MKILFCIKAMNVSGGGAERVLAEVASGLVERGHEVYVMSFDHTQGASFYPLHPDIQRICLGFGAERESSMLFRLLRYALIMRRIVKNLSPDVTIGFMHSMYIPLGLALLRSGAPVIASEHIVPEHYESRPLEAALLKLTPFLVDSITCVSEQAKQAFAPLLRKKMVVVPNPVELNINSRADVVGAQKSRKILLAVGRLDGQKDHKSLIDAFALILRDCPEWDLRIIGEGDLFSDLEKRIADLGLEGRIFMPGGTREIAKEYEAAQLFVQPSHYESYGLTVVEALGYGLPAVGFDNCIGVNQLIRHKENGILVDGAGDRATNLARGLKTLMADDDERLRLSKGGNIHLEAHHIDRVVDAWEQLLKPFIASRNGKDL